MAQATFYTAHEGERYHLTLISLDEYEEAGGTYDDSGNNGDKYTREDFVAAVALTFGDNQPDGAWDNDLDTLKMVLDPNDRRLIWWDSVTPGDWYLLRDWPANAPLEARANVG